MKRAVIIAGGNVCREDFEQIQPGDFVICADGGLDHAEAFGIVPDIVLGDFDSVKTKIDGYRTERFPAEKDQTDGELCVDYALTHGFWDITILGGFGTRLDHSMGNLFLLCYILERGGKGRLICGKNTAMVTREEITLPKLAKYISLLPLTPEVTGVETEGLLYPLRKETLKFGQTRGISNEFLKEQCKICFQEGLLLIILSDE